MTTPAHNALRARWAGRAIFGVLAALLAVQVTWLARHYAELRPVSPGDIAPLFTLPAVDDTGAISRDQTVRLEDLRGSVVIVDFWATWCGPCKAAMPSIERVYQRHRARGLEVVSVNMDNPRAARALLRARGYTMPLYVDDGRTSDAYKVTSIPHLVIIDKHGVVRQVHRGFDGEDVLDRAVSRLLRD